MPASSPNPASTAMATATSPLWRPDCDVPRVEPQSLGVAARARLAARLRQALADFALGLASGRLSLHCPPPAEVSRGEGHFHLAPELFLQLAGETRFRWPHGSGCLGPGQALLMPARLRHDETVRPGPAGQAFENLVVYSDGEVLSCHLAHEASPGRPGILYLESLDSPLAGQFRQWLSAAAANRANWDPAWDPDTGATPGQAAAESDTAPDTAPDVGPDPGAGGPANWPALQSRSLVAAALAGLRQALAAEPVAADGQAPGRADPVPAAEAAFLGRLRLLVHNQLGDADLSVARLASQLGCTADHLSFRFRQLTGDGLLARINRQRLDRACHLLRDTPMAVKEVAWACGFSSAGYFIRCFRAQQGCTPAQWRTSPPPAGGAAGA